MNLLNLKYFLTIVEEGSISMASRKLYVSQQALSEHLKKMEAELQVVLFHRKNPLVLTEAGKCFYNGAGEILNIYRQTLSDITEINNGKNEKLVIGIPTYCEPHYLLDVLVNFHNKYPECQTSIVKKMHSDIAHSIGNVDLYLSYLPLANG